MNMHEKMRVGLLDATRLVRSGSLLEATAAIQHALAGFAAPDSRATPQPAGASPAGAPIEGSFRVVESAPVAPTDKTGELPRAGPRSACFHAPLWRHRRAFDPSFRDTPPVDQAPDPLRSPDALRSCDGQPSAGRFLAASYTNDAGTRAYKLYVPSGYHGQPLPLVVMLHGCTQDADDFAAGTRMNELAEAQQCFVVYPVQAPNANTSKCWNWFKKSDQQRDQGEPSIIAGITRQIIAAYAIDVRRVYVAGLSAGGAMAATMGATYPDLYAAIGVHSGLAHAVAHDIPSAFAAMQGGAVPVREQRGVNGAPGAARPVPTIVFHGDRDKTVNPRNGDRVMAQSTAHYADRARPLAGTPQVSIERGQVPAGHAYTRTIHQDASGLAIMEQWRIHGAGHAWSGGSASGSHTDPRGPDAAREMLRFFQQHRQP